MGGEHSAMDKEGTADISPSARFGVTEAFVSNKLYEGLKKLYKIEAESSNTGTKIVFKENARKDYLNGEGKVDFDKV